MFEPRISSYWEGKKIPLSFSYVILYRSSALSLKKTNKKATKSFHKLSKWRLCFIFCYTYLVLLHVRTMSFLCGSRNVANIGGKMAQKKGITRKLYDCWLLLTTIYTHRAKALFSTQNKNWVRSSNKPEVI